MIIVGLGNPTEKYKNTYHNMGFMTIDTLAKNLNKRIIKKECDAQTSVFDKNGQKIILAKPLTFMNNSGFAVKQLMNKYNQTESDLIIIYDDIDIPRFSVRTRFSGSAGTHNGMKSIVTSINSTQFARIRIGIGLNDFDLVDYVLSNIPKEDKDNFDTTFEKVAKLLEEYINSNDFDKLMRESNIIK
ncbi:MAG: aminoacyl-tRNA hydrolase [Clostridia bacterium]